MIAADAFLLQAEAWIQLAGEASWRSAVSRAYYAAFHAARDLLRTLGFMVPRAAQAHAYLWMRLSNCGDPSLVQAGGELQQLQASRTLCDYDIHQSISHGRAANSVRTARQLIATLATGLVQPLRTQIRAAMRDYERQVLQHVTWQGP